MDFKEQWEQIKEQEAIGFKRCSPDIQSIEPIVIIGTPFMGASNKKQRELFKVSKKYIETLYTDWLTLKNNCDVRIKFAPCKDCPTNRLHILVQGFRDHLEHTIKEDWKKLEKDVLTFLELADGKNITEAYETCKQKAEQKDKCKRCDFWEYKQLIVRMFNDFKLTLEENDYE